MTFDELLAQVRELLQSKGRVSYRALKLRFNLDEDYLEGLKDELIEAEHVAADEGGKVLVWAGEGAEQETENRRSEESEKRETASSDARHQTLDPKPTAAERRQLTVMFCDLVGSTPLAEQLDPEELREVVQEYQAVCGELIHRFGGYIARYVGDALLVYFGYPHAHEDDAQRAVRAGLEIVAAMPPLNARLQPKATVLQTSPLQVRIGIHTGLVVVGEMGGDDYREAMALGETPNIAARLQGMAEPNTIVISAATSRLIAGLFTCHNLGPQTLKGVTMPVIAYRVLSESGVQSRFEVTVTTGLTPLVGREEEVGLLWQRWEQVKEGAGQVVFLSGEAGIGKSRLVRVLKERIAGETQVWLECRCSPYHQNSALYPLIDVVQRVLQFQRDDSPEEKLHKLEVTLQVGAIHEVPLRLEVVPLVASLLSLPLPNRYPPLNLTPQRQKQKTLEAVLTWLLAEAEQQPVAFIVEDLHWADPSTMEFLGLLVEQVPTARLLTILAFRPEFTPPWPSRSHLTHLTLQRLPRQQVEAMVEKLTSDQGLPAAVVQQIVAKTDGVPLFVEELTKTILESIESIGSIESAIPTTLQDSLMARLDRLGPAKEIAQLGAILGREFSYELLHAVSSLDEAALQQGLRQLVEAELLYQRGLPPQATYFFKHALVQDTAYQSLLKSTRQQYHRQIAQRLEEQFSVTKEMQPELLAHHYTEAGLAEQAISYWQQAGQRAAQRSANAEAINHLMKGLELLRTLPDTPERTQQELTLQIALGAALFAIKGYSAPEVEETHTRARVLCQQLGETPQLVPVLFRLVVFYFNRGEIQTAYELAKQMMRLAQSAQDRYLLSLAHTALGWTLYFLGELTSARLHVEQAIALCDPQQPPRLTVNTDDPRVGCLSYAAWVLWYLGYPDQALKRSHEAVALAEELSRPYSLAYALGFAAMLHLLRREGQLARERAEAVMTLSTEQGFPYWLAWGTRVQGWVLAEQGQVEEGIGQMQQGLAAFRAMGTEVGRAIYLADLATAYAKVRRVEEGLSVLAEALTAVNKTEERNYEADLYRLKGELLLAQEGHRLQAVGFREKTKEAKEGLRLQAVDFREKVEEAEACFHKAIEIARQQQAKSLELRVVMSLARLWQSHGRKEEAHRMLADIYSWFTEGFDTKDLQEAKALLTELAGELLISGSGKNT
jgi:class 3 adenylate cyclase/predicted ATPase